MANDVSAVVFCRGHGSPVPRNPHRRARTGKVGRICSGHHAANVGDPEIELLEVGCAMRSYSGGRAWRMMSSNWRSAGPPGESHALRRSRRVSSSYRNSSGPWPGLIRAEFILACSALSASLDQPSSLLRRAPHVRCPCPEPSSSILPARRQTTEHAASFVVKKSTLYKSSLAVFQAASLEPSVSIAADGTGAPCTARKATLS